MLENDTHGALVTLVFSIYEIKRLNQFILAESGKCPIDFSKQLKSFIYPVGQLLHSSPISMTLYTYSTLIS